MALQQCDISSEGFFDPQSVMTLTVAGNKWAYLEFNEQQPLAANETQAHLRLQHRTTSLDAEGPRSRATDRRLGRLLSLARQTAKTINRARIKMKQIAGFPSGL